MNDIFFSVIKQLFILGGVILSVGLVSRLIVTEYINNLKSKIKGIGVVYFRNLASVIMIFINLGVISVILSLLLALILGALNILITLNLYSW